METFWEIVSGDVRALKLTTIPLYLMAIFGFALQIFTQEVDDLAYVLSIVNVWVWLVLFSTIAVARFVGLFYLPGPSITNVLIPAVGVWIWAVMCISSFAGEQHGSMALLYLIPTAMEFWLAISGFRALRGVQWTF